MEMFQCVIYKAQFQIQQQLLLRHPLTNQHWRKDQLIGSLTGQAIY